MASISDQVADVERRSLVELLLSRASVNYNNGEVFIYAVRNFRPDTFHLLLGQNIGYKALFTAVLEALKAPNPLRKSLFGELVSRLQPDHLNTALKHAVLEEVTDLPLVRMLLDAGAEATHEEGLCIKHAASIFDRDLLRLLSEYSGHSEDVFSRAFSAVVNQGRQWISFEHVEVLEILLRHGASVHIANKAMVEVVDHLACQQSKSHLADTLLRKLFAAGADVNHDNGKVIVIAASLGDHFLLGILLANGATSLSVQLAFTAAIMAHHNEPLLLQLIDVFVGQATTVPDFNMSLPGMPPPIFLCLKSYGSSVAILDKLVKAGCRLDVTIPVQVCTGISRGAEPLPEPWDLEPVSVLMWAVMQEEGHIDLAVIQALVRHGGKCTRSLSKREAYR